MSDTASILDYIPVRLQSVQSNLRLHYYSHHHVLPLVFILTEKGGSRHASGSKVCVCTNERRSLFRVLSKKTYNCVLTFFVPSLSCYFVL